MKRYYNLSVYRLLATILILIFHIYFCCSTTVPSFAILLSKFVQGLTILSGFLYSTKDIKSIRGFYFKNLKKIGIPILIALAYTALLVLIPFIMNPANSYLSYWFSYGERDNLLFLYGNLWYIPMILICYLMTPILYQAKITKKPILIAIVIISALLELTLAGYISFFPITYISYVIGYYLGSNLKIRATLIGSRINPIMLLSSIALVGLFYLGYKYFKYETYLGNLSSTMVGTLSFPLIASLLAPLNKINKNIAFLKHTDSLSYPFYLVNQLFMCGGLRLMKNSSLINQGIVIFMATLLMAIVIYATNSIILWKLNKLKLIAKA